MGYRPVTNEQILHRMKDHKRDFTEKYINEDMSYNEKKLMKKFLQMGEDITLKVLLEFTVPVSMQLDENTKFLKRMIMWGGTVLE